MRILLDENLDARLIALMPDHDVAHTRLRGWGGIKNGALLDLMALHGFQVLISVDKNLPYQQSLKGRPFALVLLDIHPSNFKTRRYACHASLSYFSP